MKALLAAATVALAVTGWSGSTSAQYYGGPDYGYRERGPDYGDRRRDYDYGDRRRDRYAFDEDEYLRCHPDVRRAVRRGEVESGLVHYRVHGRREGRRLSC